MVDPLRRINYDEIISLIDQKRYFVLHAPRQTGKTTSLLAMVKKINEDGYYHCVYINVESAQTARNDVTRGMLAILSRLRIAVKALPQKPFDSDSQAILAENGPDSALTVMLRNICEGLSKPLVLFIDEIDALTGDVLVSVLRQLRTGYADRPKFFPIAVILFGVRDVRDYRIHQSDIEQAAEALILERATHLDQLADKLREDRVRRVIAPIIAGEHWPSNGDEPRDDDIQYAIDLGLLGRVRRTR